jgi:hypothetical protein
MSSGRTSGRLSSSSRWNFSADKFMTDLFEDKTKAKSGAGGGTERQVE